MGRILPPVEKLAELAAERGCDLNELARRLKRSPRQVNRLFHQQLGCAPHAFFDAAKLSRVLPLFEKDDEQAKEMSEVAGFAAPAHFTRWFSTRTGFTPSEFARALAAARTTGQPVYARRGAPPVLVLAARLGLIPHGAAVELLPRLPVAKAALPTVATPARVEAGMEQLVAAASEKALAGSARITVAGLSPTLILLSILLFTIASALAQGTITWGNQFGSANRMPVSGMEPCGSGACLHGQSAVGLPAGTTVYGGALLQGTGYSLGLALQQLSAVCEPASYLDCPALAEHRQDTDARPLRRGRRQGSDRVHERHREQQHLDAPGATDDDQQIGGKTGDRGRRGRCLSLTSNR